MRYRFLAAVLVVSLAAAAESWPVAKLSAFIESSAKLHTPDKEVAAYLANVRLTERLDARAIERFQGLGIGPRTLHALDALMEQSKSLAVPQPVVSPPKPVPIAPPDSEEQGRIIDEVRQHALDYSQNLPDFICTQVTRRYIAPPAGTRYGGTAGAEPAWQATDTLTVRLSYFEQKEDYKLILVNNRISNEDFRKLGGATSTGEFGSMLRFIFEPKSQARFEWDGWRTLRKRTVMAFSYSVRQANSEWYVGDGKDSVVVGYKGLVEIDRETHQVMRVTFEASDIPPAFPVHGAVTILDYDYQDLSGRRFLLPLKSETRMFRSELLSKNVVEFRLYRKFSAETEIKYDTPDPLPEEPAKDQPRK